MSEAVEFYTNPMSRGQTVRWMLEEVGEPYDIHILDYGTTMKAEPYLAVNPMGKVPAIRHKGKVVTEVAAAWFSLALLASIAVVVIGGTSVAGGFANLPGLWGAAMLLFLLVTMLNTYGFGAGIRLVLTGVIIITVITIASGHRSAR